MLDITFSDRFNNFGEEVFATLNEKLIKLQEQGKTIYNLSIGTPDFVPPEHIKAALAEAAADPRSWKYSLRDLPELKQAVCDYYRDRFGVEGITPDMVASCNGTQEGMGHFGLTLCNPGDVVLLPDPCYPVFKAAAVMAGAEPYYYKLCAEHDFLPHVADIPARVADKAKYMVVSLPANPVGSVGTPEVYNEVIAFARKHNILLVHDNAYSDIVYDGPAGGSFLNYEGALEQGVEFFSLSKSFNVTGARMGFLVGRADVVQAFAKLRSQIDFGMFYPIQRAAIAALTGPREQVEEQRMMYQARRDALCDGLESIGWERPNAHGTMFVWAKIPGYRTSSMAFCEELMEKAGVVVTPGASFGPSGEGYVRMALVLPPEKIAEAVEAIKEAGITGERKESSLTQKVKNLWTSGFGFGKKK